MIFRRPTRIELKRENDMGDYERFKQDMQRKQKSSRLFSNTHDQSNFLTPSTGRNREMMSIDRNAYFSNSNYMSGDSYPSHAGEAPQEYYGSAFEHQEEPEYRDNQNLLNYLITSSKIRRGDDSPEY